MLHVNVILSPMNYDIFTQDVIKLESLSEFDEGKI